MDDMQEEPQIEESVRVWTVEEIAKRNPFDQDATCILVDDHQLNLTQLTDEISKVTSTPVQLAQINIPDVGTRWMYVCPPIEVSVVNRCIDEHVPDPDYGLPPEVKERQELLKKINDGIPLSSDEVMRALRLSLASF